MPELDPFDARLTAAVHAFANRAETGVDATAVAERTIRFRPRGTFAWLAAPLPVPAWIILVAGLLLAALLGATMIGGAWRDDRLSIVPSQSPSPATTATAEIDLAGVRAHTLPRPATCPAGADPDMPGPAHRLWPAAGTTSMAFDLQSGKIVAVVALGDGSQTWTFDVCSNTWAQLGGGPGVWMPTLVYDADSDRTVALDLTGRPGAISGRVAVWSYDLEADRWLAGTASPVLTRTRASAAGPDAPRYGFAPAYHDPSGLVVVYDGTRAWAYDVEADAWSAVRWEEDWVRPSYVTPMTLAYDPVRDRFVLNVNGTILAEAYGGTGNRTVTLDPVTGRDVSSRPGLGFPCPRAGGSCGTVFDRTTDQVVWTDGRTHVEAWDPRADDWGAWETLHYVTGEQAAASPDWCEGSPPAADSLNGRIVCRGPAGSVAAFTPATRQWQWLLEPSGDAGSLPSPAVGGDAGANVLATTQAHALPPEATCPLDTDPDAPGPVHGARPAAGTTATAFDRQSGMIVALVTFPPDSAQTWAFDVCTNAWTRQSNAPGLVLPVLVYDADSDLTIALSGGPLDRSSGIEAWSYDLDADNWVRRSDGPVPTSVARGSTTPWSYLKAAYHDPSGLVVVYDGTRMWAYDVEADRWSSVRQQESADTPAGVYATTFSYDPNAATFVAHAGLTRDGQQAALTFDPVAGTWRRGPGIGFSGLHCSWVQTFGCAAAFDAATGMTIHVDRGRVDGWDSAQDSWTTLSRGKTADAEYVSCTGDSAFDTLNGRLACVASDGSMAAFTPTTRAWKWLLEPQD
jgi:outer membrane lipoprotein-sorting protein